MKISNSQISSFQKCQKRFFFEHVKKLKPLAMPEPMQRGIDGHLMMEAFFNAAKEGKSFEECIEAINPVLPELSPASLSVYRHVIAFGAYFFSQPWKVIAVEISKIDSATGKETSDDYAYTPDLVIEWTSGVQRGQQAILDYKFTGQYWSDREINMAQQLPKYMIYLNKNHGYKIRHCAVVMLNTRASQTATGSGLFLMKWLPISKAKLEAIEADNIELIRQVASAKQHWTPDKFRRTVDAYQCKLCPFAEDLCPADFEGRDTHRIEERNYMINTYFDDNYEDMKVLP